MKPCHWQSDDPPDAFRCQRCGHETPRADIKVLPYRRTCKIQRRGIGDIIARIFGWIGFHQKSGCGCKSRQQTLNRWFPFDTRVWKNRIAPFLWPVYYVAAKYRR